MSSRALLERLLTTLAQTAASHENRFEIEDVPLPLRLVTSLALGVNELVSDAVKHRTRRVDVTLRVHDGLCSLEVGDDGSGFPDDFDAASAANTGLDLIELTRRDTDGQLCYGSNPSGGTCVTLRFPVPSAA